MTPALMRWRDYFLRYGEGFDYFWESFLAGKKRDLLFVLGHGFDARMCDGIERILKLGGNGTRDVILLAFHEGVESHSHAYGEQRKENGERLATMIAGRGEIFLRNINMFSEDGHRVAARNVAKEFESCAVFQPYSDVIVDISALPRGLYFPLLAKLLALFDAGHENGEKRNLHVIVSHSPTADKAILDEGLEESASFLFGFAAANFESESTSEKPKIWIPILGKGQRVQLERINQLVAPDEICPLLPSPSEDPREGDSIMIEYRELLFDQLRVEPRNIIHASESNPFEVYRQIVRSILQYDRALNSLGGCKVALSAMSSKLASMGVLLAAYELGRREPKLTVGVAHVESQGYRVEPMEESMAVTTMYTMWLSGECYDS